MYTSLVLPEVEDPSPSPPVAQFDYDIVTSDPLPQTPRPPKHRLAVGSHLAWVRIQVASLLFAARASQWSAVARTVPRPALTRLSHVRRPSTVQVHRIATGIQKCGKLKSTSRAPLERMETKPMRDLYILYIIYSKSRRGFVIMVFYNAIRVKLRKCAERPYCTL